MVVTRTTVAINPPWSPGDLASAFGQALVAGGYSSFLASFTEGASANRVLQVNYDSTKALGTAFHWFMFSGESIYLSVATNWNTTTNKPTGTKYQNYISDVTNSVASHLQIAQLNANAATSITVWKSGFSDFAWFLIRSGTTYINFHIPKVGPESYFDLSKDFYHPFIYVRGIRSGQSSSMAFARPLIRLGTSGCYGAGQRGLNNDFNFGADSQAGQMRNLNALNLLSVYHCLGNTFQQGGNYSLSLPGTILPVQFSNVNTAYTSNRTPIFTGLRVSPYSPAVLPADFGIVGYYEQPNMAVFDQFVDGAAKWDIIEVPDAPLNPTVDDDKATALFVAQTAA